MGRIPRKQQIASCITSLDDLLYLCHRRSLHLLLVFSASPLYLLFITLLLRNHDTSIPFHSSHLSLVLDNGGDENEYTEGAHLADVMITGKTQTLCLSNFLSYHENDSMIV